MKFTFKLKEPKSNNDTLILFSCYFKKENKRFIYSTGEKINPVNWDFENKYPFSNGKFKSKYSNAIKTQLDRYSEAMTKIEYEYKIIKEDLTSKLLKLRFDEEFKKTKTGRNIFFDSYDEFMNDKIKNEIWSDSTIKRYNNIKNILLGFQTSKKYTLTFHTIDENFLSEFKSYCRHTLNHIDNTYSRNLGLFKTFMYWAKDKRYTYNDSFVKFEKPKRVITNQVALSLNDLNLLMSYEFDSKRLERVRDVFVFSCVTGLRFGELSLVSKSAIDDDDILIKELKDKEKEARRIPLTSISRYILKKYDYVLPLIKNQKQNEYIKEVFKELDFTKKVQRITKKGNVNIVEEMNLYDRISSHTARRTFITLLKSEGKSDKMIASVTGHKDFKTLNQYYQVSDEEKTKAINDVFKIDIPMRKIVDK